VSAAALDAAPYVAGALGAGGVGVWLSGQRELVRRWTTWVVTAPVVGGALAFGSGGATVLASVLAVVAVREYARLVGCLTAADRVFLQVSAVLLPVLAYVAPSALGRAALLAPAAAAMPALGSGDTERGGRRAAYTAFGTLWIGALAQLVTVGPRHAFALCLAVSVADVAAWAGGRLLGGMRFTPISPSKTLGGLVTSAVAGVGVLVLLGSATPALVVAVAIGGPIGDLLESAFKREAGVKDAGGWLPGFGGLLDRIDSLLVALAIAGALA
jgi:phosphatidate cytidylyltransferase